MKKPFPAKILISLCVNIAIASVAIFVFGTYIFMDDDNILGYMTYGIITEASSRVYYTNVLLGWLYKHLFSLVPGFNWQTLVYYLGMTFSGTVGLYSLLEKKNKNLIILWFLFELVFFNDVYIYLTYSVVAAFVACQGYLALFLVGSKNEKRKILYVASGLSLVFSSMVRFDAFLGVSGFAFFVWLILVLRDVEGKCGIKCLLQKYIYPFVVILGVCLSFSIIDHFSYSKGDWKAYREYEKERHISTDYRNSATTLDFDNLETLGVNESMARAVFEWRNNDPEILPTEVLATIANTKKDYNYISSPYVWKDYMMQWSKLFTRFREVYFVLLLLFFSIWIVWKNDGRRAFLLLILLFPFLGEFFYFAFIGRIDGGCYPDQSVYTVLMGLAMGLMSLYCVYDWEKVDCTIVLKMGFMVLAVSAILVQPTKDYRVKGLGLVNTREISKEYGFLGNPGKVYVCEYEVRTFIEESYGAWQTPPEGFMDQCVVLGSWLVNHPMQNKHQESLGVANPYRALFENDDVYYLSKRGSSDLVLEYLRENYDDMIDYEYIKEKGEFKVFKYYLDK